MVLKKKLNALTYGCLDLDFKGRIKYEKNPLKKKFKKGFPNRKIEFFNKKKLSEVKHLNSYRKKEINRDTGSSGERTRNFKGIIKNKCNVIGF